MPAGFSPSASWTTSRATFIPSANLDYQIIAENTDVWQNILGPRKVYVKTGGEWVEVGEFPYPDFGAVKVQVWLDHPMDIDAVGTIAQCRLPNTFWFRQVVTDFASPSA